MNALAAPLPFADDRQRQDALVSHLVDAGYARREPPMLQPAAAFFGSGEDMRGRLYLTHALSGEELCLRPEYTIPVCRLYLDSPEAGRPATYCYCGPVFRLRRDGPGEFVQAGIENLGRADREAADAEILALSLEAASLVKPARFATTIGDAALFSDLVDALAVPPPWRRRITRGLAQGKRLAGILDAPTNGGTDHSGVLAALGLIPGLPKFAFFSVAGGLMYAAYKIKPEVQAREAAVAEGSASAGAGKPGAPSPATDPMDAVLKLDELMLEVGVGLVPMVDVRQGGQLLTRVKALRKNLAQQLGFLVPSIHITDNLSLRDGEYVVNLRGVEIARWELRKGMMLAISSDASVPNLPGESTREPAFDVPAKWISSELQPQAIATGYTVVDGTSVLAAHLAELVKRNAYELLSRGETKRLIDRLQDSHPKLSEELIPKLMSLGEVQKVLQQLLREQVSIRDMGTILEALVETATLNKNPVALVEGARQALGRALIRPLLDGRGELNVVTLDASIEEECMRAAGMQSGQMSSSALQLSVARRVLDSLRGTFGEQIGEAPPVLLCSSPGRFYLRRVLEPFLPKVVVISPGEIPPMTLVQSVGVVR